MQRSEQPAGGRERGVRPRRRRVARHVGQHLAALVVEPEHFWGALEADIFEVAEQGVHGRCPTAGGTADGVPDADDRTHRPTGELYLRAVHHGRQFCRSRSPGNPQPASSEMTAHHDDGIEATSGQFEERGVEARMLPSEPDVLEIGFAGEDDWTRRELLCQARRRPPLSWSVHRATVGQRPLTVLISDESPGERPSLACACSATRRTVRPSALGAACFGSADTQALGRP